MTIDIDGGQQIIVRPSVRACSSGGDPGGAAVPLGLHTLPGMPADANFGVRVDWPGPGAATLVLRSLANWDDPSLYPPITVIR